MMRISKFVIPDFGETNRLVIKNSALEECEKIQQVNEESDYLEKWVGWKTPRDYAYITLTVGNLPPEGKKEYFKAKSVYLKETNELIGVLELYFGYPSEEILSIGWIFILTKYQKMGFAKEVINYLIYESIKNNFSKIRLGVHLKNWSAIRFWHKVGFNEIVDIIGDDIHSDNTFASLILQKRL